MLLYMEPIDTLFFRDNRPFEAGTDSFAETTMPSPLTIYGAIGSYFLKKNGTDINKFLNGKAEDPTLGWYDEKLERTQLRVTGLFLSWGGALYVPPPANFLQVYGRGCHPAVPAEHTTFKWDIDEPELRPLVLPGDECNPVEGYILLDEVTGRLLKGTPLLKPSERRPADYFPTEQRFGHKTDRGKSVAEEGFLYTAMHRRFRDELQGEYYMKLKLIASITGVESEELEEVITLGGEGKKVKLTIKRRELNLEDTEVLSKIKEKRRFFVYLLTPAIFKGGWRRAEWLDEFRGATLVGAAVKKPLYLSGWKRSKASQGEPRPMKKAVPQGCVYFFEADSWDDAQFEQLYKAYNFNKSLSEEYPCAGFGISLLGVW